jgi:hypothetical protein
MKIYCSCNNCDRKVYLSAKVRTRQGLANIWGRHFNINCPHCKNNSYTDTNLVYAESSKDVAPIPGIGGGTVIGMIGGPLGMIFGAIIGGVVGGSVSHSDKQAVKYFNNHFIK